MLDLLPLFPLPNVVLFPNVFLPLHIFEPRYRDMIADALLGDRMIGMVLLKPGWEHEYEGRPAVYPIGCSGLITHVERLPDGKFNIVLRGLERFRVVAEDHGRSYRRATVDSLIESRLSEDESAALRHHRAKLESLLLPVAGPASTEVKTASMSDEELVNALAQYLDLEAVEKQALLEKNCLNSRAESLVEVLEMKMLMARIPGVSHQSH
jgi:Lon protease-like protein